jgi:subtilisin family serine protease
MRKLKVTICLCLVFSFLVAGLTLGVGAAPAPDASKFVPGEVIVGLEAVTVDSVQALRGRGGSIIKEISVLKALVVKVRVGSEDEYIQKVRSIPGFRYAERNGIVQAVYMPNDPDWGQLWNMRIIEADDAWDAHKGSTSVVIAIVDTGVDYSHNDLSAHYVSGGYDWVNNDADPWDDQYHGTHCAGIAAAVMDNGVGVVGVAQCSVWAEKVLDAEGYGDWVDLAYGIWHATNGGVDIISMSLGGFGYSSLLDSACTYAWNHGVVLVAAAGNDNTNIDTVPFYPASFSTVIAVSATTSSDLRWSGSNYGSKIELAAPGVSVYSTIPGNRYTSLTGTSMACPHVAGVAALTWSYNPSLTNVQLRDRLHTAVDDLGASGKDVYYGYGRINAYKALTGAPEFKYNFRLDPYVNVIHLNTNPGGWLNGYMTGGPMDWNPVLGKYEDGRFYMAVDVYPDNTPGYYDMWFLVGTAATRTGQFIGTYDGMSYDGPYDVNLVPVAGQSKELQGPDITEVSGSQVTPEAWYVFQIHPFTEIAHLNTNPSGWLNGYDETPEPDAPVLGFAEGGRFYFGIDLIHPTTYYQLAFITGRVSARDGDVIETVDGTTFNGPDYVWLTPI